MSLAEVLWGLLKQFPASDPRPKHLLQSILETLILEAKGKQPQLISAHTVSKQGTRRRSVGSSIRTSDQQGGSIGEMQGEEKEASRQINGTRAGKRRKEETTEASILRLIS
jgi:hypothetical protein